MTSRRLSTSIPRLADHFASSPVGEVKVMASFMVNVWGEKHPWPCRCTTHFPMDSNSDEALDIIVTNVVATFRTRCHLNLRTIALEGTNVIYKPEAGVRHLPTAAMQKTHSRPA